jgi:hypothetical protein
MEEYVSDFHEGKDDTHSEDGQDINETPKGHSIQETPPQISKNIQKEKPKRSESATGNVAVK